MENIPQNLNNWAEFENKVSEIDTQNSKSKIWEKIIFRGQSNADWKLASSLERFSNRDFSYEDYDAIIENYLKNPIFVLTKGQVDLVKYETHNTIPKFTEYMVYLRVCFETPSIGLSEG